MKAFSKITLLLLAGLLVQTKSKAQLNITSQSNAAALVQKLVGPGVSVSNITLTGSPLATGFFNNVSGTNIGLDSGIVLANGRVKTEGPAWGMDGNGLVAAYTDNIFATDSSSSGAFASTTFNLPGDASLSTVLGGALTFDATVLEFDFVPLGDTIRFRYVFSSEEYPSFPCGGVNDAFAFLINGPGYPINTNIALIPGTNFPVTIDNIQYNGPCAPGAPYFPQFYISNRTNKLFTHNGHTTIFTAMARVIPCQTYHLKLVIADVGDYVYDSGVFLEAKSLSSNGVQINNITQVDQQNNNYLVEGCATGSFKLKRALPEPSPLVVTLNYAGTATNGVDVQLLPTSVIIPANQTETTVNVIPIIDNLPEGTETLKIYALGGCAGTPSDSTVIQIRDYDTLGIAPDTAYICRNNTIQLTATSGYTTYLWDTDPTLSNLNIRNPVASPVAHATTYYCTATEGTCHGRDSAFIVMKDLEMLSKKEINCKNDATGEIRVSGGPEWVQPIRYSINNGPWQPDSSFLNLPVGIYRVKIKDGTGCLDSMDITITQLYPDFLISSIPITAATCSGNPDGTAYVNLVGGKTPYLFSSDGINFQASPLFNLLQGNYTIVVKDNNNCPASQAINIPLYNHITLDAGPDITICEGKSGQILATSNADAYSWTPAATLDNSAIINPIANPVTTTQYKITATAGICSRLDSVIVYVNPSPVADAGPDITICYGQDIQLNGSGGVSYFWYPYSYLDNVRIPNPTAKQLPGSIRYYLNVINDKGCYSLKRDSVFITVTRPAAVDAGRDTVLAIGQALPLFARDVNNTGFNQYEWYPNYGLNNANIQNPLLVADRDLTYTVTARSSIGCMATDQIRVKVYKGPDIYVPNAFTPNNDGLNDILKAIPVGIRDFHYFRIFDRWGKPVFVTDNAGTGWDGRVKGNVVVTTGTYIWMAEGIDYLGNIVRRKGSVLILK